MTATASGASHYEILGIPSDATTEEVKKAFNRAAKHLHPDRTGGVELPFYLLAVEARDVLLDPERRAAYDAQLTDTTAGPEPEPAPEPEPVWEGEETVNLDDDLEEEEHVGVDFDVVDDPHPAPDPDQWAPAGPAEDALPSTPAQRRTWWRVTGAVFLALAAVWWYAAIASQTVRLPAGVSDWSGIAAAGGFWWTAAAVYTILARPFRRIVLTFLAGSTLISLYLGWQAWALGTGHTYLPLHPAAAAGLSLLLALVGRRAWQLHKGRRLDTAPEADDE